MKSFLPLLILLVSTSAFASSQRASSVTEMKNAALDVLQLFGDDTDCHVTMTGNDAGFSITLKDEKNHVATLDVKPDARVTAHFAQEDADGSDVTFKLASGGSLNQIHADDAFDEVILTGADGSRADCVNDY